MINNYLYLKQFVCTYVSWQGCSIILWHADKAEIIVWLKRLSDVKQTLRVYFLSCGLGEVTKNKVILELELLDEILRLENFKLCL